MERATYVGDSRERNPYTTYMLNGPEIGAILAQTNEILKKVSEGDDEIIKHTEFVDRWLGEDRQQEALEEDIRWYQLR